MTVLLAFLSCLVLVTAQGVDRGQASIDDERNPRCVRC